MEDTIIIRIPLDENPKSTAQEKGVSTRGGKVHHYEKPEVKQMRNIYTVAIKQEIIRHGLKNCLPIIGAVALDVTFYYATKDKKKFGQPKTSKPDCDNIIKLLQDALADCGFFMFGDEQVTKLTIGKYWSENPEIIIKIAPHIVWRTYT